MNHPIDDLFSKKLQNIEIAPSAGAWEKVQNKNKKKVYFSRWYGIAASLIILLMAGIYMNSLQSVNTTSDPVALVDISEKPPVEQEDREVVLPIISEEERKVIQGEKNEQPAESTPSSTAVKTSKIRTTKDPSKPDLRIEDQQQREITLPEDIARIESSIAENNIQKRPDEIADIKPAEILLTAMGPPSQNIIEKIASKAKDLKEKDGLMAELREMKDEVFTFEFLKNSKKSI